jgi:site-specific DNA-methyltransferase (adenine-specific)
MGSYEIKIGNCLDVLKTMEDESVNCVVTSPPYYGLRDYDTTEQIGHEKTSDEYIQKMVQVFGEIKRILKQDGTVWLNIGDSYVRSSHNENNLKTKDIMFVPHRLAIALQQDGWWVRQDIVWSKPNVMPDGVRDRCVKSHEYIFLLSKSKKYYFDAKAIEEEASVKNNRSILPKNTERTRQIRNVKDGRCDSNFNEAHKNTIWMKRRKRSVWHIPASPYIGAHFATFPPSLIEPCILAGCPVGGLVLDPFGGSGTTAGVAIKNNRNAILIELNPEYVELVSERIKSITGFTIQENENLPLSESLDKWFD